MSERALSSTSWAVASFPVWGGWGSELAWMAGTVSTLKRGCQRVRLSSATDNGGTNEDRKACRHRGLKTSGHKETHQLPKWLPMCQWKHNLHSNHISFILKLGTVPCLQLLSHHMKPKEKLYRSKHWPCGAVWQSRPGLCGRCVSSPGDKRLTGRDGLHSGLRRTKHTPMQTQKHMNVRHIIMSTWKRDLQLDLQFIYIPFREIALIKGKLIHAVIYIQTSQHNILRRGNWVIKDRGTGVLTRENRGLHSELVAALVNAAVKCWDVLFLSKCVSLRKDGLYLTHVALFKPPKKWRKGGEKKH